MPPVLFRALEGVRTDSPFVFAANNEQLWRFHVAPARPDNARRVGTEFKPLCPGDWFADRMDGWPAAQPGGHAHTHVPRKTTLQYARIGEDIHRQLAADARVGESVLISSYVRETDEQLRQSSNRTSRRIVAGFPAGLGYTGDPAAALEEQLRAAVEGKDGPGSLTSRGNCRRDRPRPGVADGVGRGSERTVLVKSCEQGRPPRKRPSRSL